MLGQQFTIALAFSGVTNKVSKNDSQGYETPNKRYGNEFF